MTAASPDFTSGDLTAYQAGDVDLMLGAAEAAVRAFCGWHIAPSRSETITVNGSGRLIQPLPSLYVTAVDSVTETRWNGSTSTTDTLTLGTDYDWSQAGYLTRVNPTRARYWTYALRGVTAAITHGYDTFPEEVRAVILALASRGQESPAGGGVDMAGPFRFTPGKNEDGTSGGLVLSSYEQSVLSRYRIPARP